MHRCAPPAAIARARVFVLALVAISTCALPTPKPASAAAATVVERTAQPGKSFVVRAGTTRRHRATVGEGIAKVTLRMTPLGRRPASLSVRAGRGTRWHGRLRGERSRRLRLRVRAHGPRLRLVFRARGSAVRIERLSVSARQPTRSSQGEEPALTPVPSEPTAAPTPPPADAPTTPGSPRFTTLVYADEFSGPAGGQPSGWQYEVGGHGWGNDELQSFTNRPANSAFDGSGDLDLVARNEEFTGHDGYTRSYTSARMFSDFSFQYGKVEARIKPPAGTGLWPNFWMMGNDVWDEGWPWCGEFNIMEMLGQEPATVNGTLHAPFSSEPVWLGPQWQNGKPYTASTPLTNGYHVYGLKWWDGGAEWSIDGVPYHRVLRSDTPEGGEWVFDKPFHLRLSMAVGGSWPGPPNAETQFPATMHVDWVRVYQ